MISNESSVDQLLLHKGNKQMTMKRKNVLYQCNYMFRPLGDVFRVFLEHFKVNIQIAFIGYEI